MVNKKILLIIPVLLVLGILYSGYSYLKSFQPVTITVDNTTDKPYNIKIYKFLSHESDESEYDKSGSPVKDISGTETFKLKKGSYVAIAKKQGALEATETEFFVGSEPTSFSVSPKYDDIYLQSVLDKEKDAILSAIFNQVPSIKPPEHNYKIEPGRLYGQGQWYGTTLKPVVTTPNTDVQTYRLVAQKQGGSWKIVSTQPEIILSKPNYPTVPRYVLNSINKQ